jgi:hypothetical protein
MGCQALPTLSKAMRSLGAKQGGKGLLQSMPLPRRGMKQRLRVLPAMLHGLDNQHRWPDHLRHSPVSQPTTSAAVQAERLLCHAAPCDALPKRPDTQKLILRQPLTTVPWGARAPHITRAGGWHAVNHSQSIGSQMPVPWQCRVSKRLGAACPCLAIGCHVCLWRTASLVNHLLCPTTSNFALLLCSGFCSTCFFV